MNESHLANRQKVEFKNFEFFDKILNKIDQALENNELKEELRHQSGNNFVANVTSPKRWCFGFFPDL